MSRTSLYGVPSQGELETVSEYPNGWGSAPVIWEFIWKKYLQTTESARNYESCMHPQGNLKKICDLANDGKLLDHERICVQLTFDLCVVRKEDFPTIAGALDTMYLATFNGVHANHLKAIATDLREADKWTNYIGCCFRHTSVGDAWAVYERDEGGVTESRRYDLARDQGHWFIQASLEAIDRVKGQA